MHGPSRRTPSRWKPAVLFGAVLALVSALLGGSAAAAAPGGLSVRHPVVDGRTDPLNVTGQHPALGWQLDSPRTNVLQSAYRILVAGSPQQLAPGRADVWDSGKVRSDDSVSVPYGGPRLAPGHRYYWTVRVWDGHGDASAWSRPAAWESALATPADWKGARWITPEPGGSDAPAAPMLRRSFHLDKKVVRARAYVYGLGFHELHLNGAKVGDHVLAPANTPYAQRGLYDTYDVTDALRQGSNAVGIWLGTGYGKNFSQYGFRWTGPEQAIMLIQVSFADGTRRSITTDTSWKWSNSPITSDDLYDGEVYDARKAQQGWDRAGFDDAAWRPVTTADAPGGALLANTMPPMRVLRSLRPVKVTEPGPGLHVYDFGENFAGWERVRATGPAGTTLTLRTAEELKADGTLDTSTNRDAASTDTFVLAGTGHQETYEPRFTYHGFRYLEVKGYPGTPGPGDVTGRVVHADLASTGSFGSSDELLDRTRENNRRSILNNSMSIPTDNPVRDERTPPGMDVQAYQDASVREFAMDGFYAKYLQDMPPGTALPTDDAKAQQPDMGGDQVVLAWSLYEQYGDRATLTAHYPAMKRFVDTNATDVPGHIWPQERGFGDWCPPDHGPAAGDGMGGPDAGDCFSEVSLVNTALSYRQAQAVARSAAALGHSADVRHYTALADGIKKAFNDRFLDAASGTYGDGRQVTSVLPLAFGMVPEDAVKAVGDRLADRIVQQDDSHLDTGIFGTRYLVDALAGIGRIDLAMTMLGQRSYPGFGFEIEHGATTSWEQWLYASSMETHDHAMFAGVNASLYTVLGGIRPSSPAYRTATIAPVVPAGLTHVSASVDTVRGTIATAWSKHHGAFDLTVTVPANATALVRVPMAVTDGHGTVRAPAGAERVRDAGDGGVSSSTGSDGGLADGDGGRSDGGVSYSVGSGTWHFRVR